MKMSNFQQNSTSVNLDHDYEKDNRPTMLWLLT